MEPSINSFELDMTSGYGKRSRVCGQPEIVWNIHLSRGLPLFTTAHCVYQSIVVLLYPHKGTVVLGTKRGEPGLVKNSLDRVPKEKWEAK